MTTTLVNSIVIPDRFVAACHDWYNGIDCMLYAISSTGGLTIGTICPLRDNDDFLDPAVRNRKWYLAIWRDLSVDVGRAARDARKMYGGDGHTDYEYEADLLDEFEKWVDTVCNDLEVEYGLADWEL